MALSNCPLYDLLIREDEPEQKFFNHAVAKFETQKMDLALIFQNESLRDTLELRPAQTISRLVQIFEKLAKKTSSHSVSVDIFRDIVMPLVRVHNGPVSFDQCIELVGSSLPIITNHLNVYLRDVADMLIKNNNMFEHLLSSERHAPIIQRWLSSKQHQQLLGYALVEELTEKALRLGGNCTGDHDIDQSCRELEDIQELGHKIDDLIKFTCAQEKRSHGQQENLVPLNKMRVLGEDEKKSNKARQEKKAIFKMPFAIEEGLKKLGIPPPQGAHGMPNAREQLREKVPHLLCAAVASFPCRLCSERLTGNAPIAVSTDHRNIYSINSTEGQINLYGEPIGAWKVLLSDLAMTKTKQLIDSGKLTQVEQCFRDLAQGRWKKSRRVPHGSDAKSVPVIPIRHTPITTELCVVWQIDAGYYDEMTERKQFGQTIKSKLPFYLIGIFLIGLIH